MATAFLMYTKTLSLEKAFSLVKKAQPCAKPNDGFWRQLAEYDKVIAGK